MIYRWNAFALSGLYNACVYKRKYCSQKEQRGFCRFVEQSNNSRIHFTFFFSFWFAKPRAFDCSSTSTHISINFHYQQLPVTRPRHIFVANILHSRARIHCKPVFFFSFFPLFLRLLSVIYQTFFPSLFSSSYLFSRNEIQFVIVIDQDYYDPFFQTNFN